MQVLNILVTFQSTFHFNFHKVCVFSVISSELFYWPCCMQWLLCFQLRKRIKHSLKIYISTSKMQASPTKKGICKATQVNWCRGGIIYGNAEQNIWKEISEHEVVHFWTGNEECRKNVCAWRKRAIRHTMVNEKAIKMRKKATCCISTSVKETMHPMVVLNHHCCFKNQPTTLIFSPT